MVNIILGNNEDERINKRPVIINISIRFLNENRACDNDELNQTICYATLLDFLKKQLEKTNFKLIEKVTQFIYDKINEYVKENRISNIQLRVELIKTNPPAEGLESAAFIISDW
ncbi:MAG: dihydroneopterin aldolase [Alphaproteobacteria bacterium]|nr:dihydroneopterin aldolase [Alphaproteobacteria bacterium]